MTNSASDVAPDEPITLLVTEGIPNEGTLTVRVTWEHRDELRELLVGEGLRTSDVLEFSTGANLLAILDVGMHAGGVAAAGWALRRPLVRALELFVERQKTRKVHVKLGDIEIDTVATSQKDVVQLVDKAIELQRQRDADWAKLGRDDNEPPTDGPAASAN
jgi:hypothetical protein